MSHFKIRSPQAEKAAALRKLAADNPYPAEGEAAAAKADDLMKRHDISEEDLVEPEVHPLISFLFGKKP